MILPAGRELVAEDLRFSSLDPQETAARQIG